MVAQSFTIQISAVQCGVYQTSRTFLSNLWEYFDKSYIAENYILVLFCITDIANNDMPPNVPISRSNAKNGHYAVQGHSRSPISVPIESSCATSY